METHAEIHTDDRKRMKRDTVKTVTFVIPISLLTIAVALSGCGSAGSAPSDAVTIAQTKASAQLMRNSISGAISPDITAAVSQLSDASETCGGEKDGTMRRWRSTAMTELMPASADKVVSIQSSIAGSLAGKGWKLVSSKVSDTSTLTTLTKPTALASIEITSTMATNSAGTGATLFVNVVGECVSTAGAGSEELKELGE